MAITTPKETILSYVCGLIFSAAWWVWLDAFIWQTLPVTNDGWPPKWTHFIPGAVSTLALIL
jgi:hypothetical protein